MAQPFILWNQWLAADTVAASSTASGFDADDVLVPTEVGGWAPSSLTAPYLVVHSDTVTLHDALVIHGTNIDGVSAELRSSTDNFVADDTQVLASTELAAPAGTAWLDAGSFAAYYFKVIFTDLPSNAVIHYVGIFLRTELPLLGSDCDINQVTAVGGDLYSAGGIYGGSYQLRAERELTVDPGLLTTSQQADWQDVADNTIKALAPFFFVPDAAADDVFFGTWKTPRWNCPIFTKAGLYKLRALTMRTRAA